MSHKTIELKIIIIGCNIVYLLLSPDKSHFILPKHKNLKKTQQPTK